MPRATCRCGQPLNLPDDGNDRIICPKCGAKVRVRRPNSLMSATVEDGFIRFSCPCGRRLKVSAAPGVKPSHGKCPDCGRVVPVPDSGVPRDVEAPTEEMAQADVQRVAEWSKRYVNTPAPASTIGSGVPKAEPVADKTVWTSEAGLRVCPGCGRPVHLGASVCRGCGSAVPKR